MRLSSQKIVLLLVRVGLFGYWIALIVGTHMPGDGLSPTEPPHDKMLHFTAYFVLTALSFLWVSLEGWTIRNAALTLLPVLILHGALDELTQSPIPSRYADMRDWAADCLGAAVGLVVAATLALCWQAIGTQRTRVEKA